MILKRRPQRVRRQFRAVKISLRQIHQRIRNLPGVNSQRLHSRLADGKVGRHAPAGNSRGAAVRPKPGVFDDIVPDFKPYLHALVAAAAAESQCIGIGNAVDMARVKNVLNRDLRINFAKPFSQIHFRLVHSFIINANWNSTEYLI